MRAVVYREFGGPEVLGLEQVDLPKMSQNTVLVRTRAAALNPADHMLQEGLAEDAMDAFFPVIPGWDVAGVVERVGPGVWELAPGDEVIGYVRSDVLHAGTYAEFVAADVGAFVRRPRRMSWEAAAGLPLAGLTAHQALDRVLAVRSGETLLVHGGAGGVGSLAVQLAVARGARVLGTASPANHAYLRTIGAEPLDYGDELLDEVRSRAPDGVDAVLDTAGRGGLDLTPRVGTAEVRAAMTTGDHPLARPVFARLDRAHLEALVALAEDGRLDVRVAATYPLEEAADAQRALRTGHSPGKIVLVP
jgi:NADPH:quinone reductase-like Zn-dependent oxidoreductase